MKFRLGFALLACSICVFNPVSASAHTLYSSQTIGTMNSYGVGCIKRHLWFGDGTAGKIRAIAQVNGYRSNCTTSQGIKNSYTVVLAKYNGGPWNGFSGCALQTKFAPGFEAADQQTFEVSAPCGAGYYAAYLCAGSGDPNERLHVGPFSGDWYGIVVEGSHKDCVGDFHNWLWSPDWHYFS